MTGKWTPFVVGALVGAVAILGLLQAMDARKGGVVYAQDSSNPSGTFALGIGSTEQNRSDLVVIVYKRPNESADGKDLRGPDRITLAFYKPAPGNVNEPRIGLHSVREITWDLQLMKHNNEGGVKLEDVLETLKKQKKTP